MSDTALKEAAAFLADWSDNGARIKDCFTNLKDYLANMDNVKLDWKARPGVTYSLRAAHPSQQKRDMFTMVDIIDDDPENRWLSVCFYDEMITDPDELAEFAPGGLGGEDASCFDVDEWDEPLLQYVRDRLDEAAKAASAEA